MVNLIAVLPTSHVMHQSSFSLLLQEQLGVIKLFLQTLHDVAEVHDGQGHYWHKSFIPSSKYPSLHKHSFPFLSPLQAVHVVKLEHY